MQVGTSTFLTHLFWKTTAHKKPQQNSSNIKLTMETKIFKVEQKIKV
jgi:hypothetical protein